MARGRMMFFVFLGLLLLAVNPVMGTPIPGSPNEIVDSSFESNSPAWTYSGSATRMLENANIPAHSIGSYYAGVYNIGVKTGQVSQIVDDFLNPLYNPLYNRKVVDLEAYIAFGGTAGSNPGTISFRLDYWYDKSDTTPAPGTADVVTPWVTYDSSNFTPLQWYLVNPFNQIEWDYQPRWIAVEVAFDKTGTNAYRLVVDDLNLTAKCVVPLPPSALLFLSGVVGLGILGWRRRSV